ncbi:MAG: hypothetical protein AAF633_05085 [Chloroflexota bacterium]
MNPKFKQLINTLTDPLFLGSGEKDPCKRQMLTRFALDVSFEDSTEGDFFDPILLIYLEKVTKRPRSINNRDIEILKMAGYSEEQIYAITLRIALAVKLLSQKDLAGRAWENDSNAAPATDLLRSFA